MKKGILFIVSILISLSAFSQQTFLKMDKSVIPNRYITYESFNGRAEIWSRTRMRQSNGTDIKIMDMKMLVKATEEIAMNAICSGKKVYDGGKTILGCGSVVGSAACIVTGGGGGVGVPVCAVTMTYAATTGMVDCISGVTSAIGEKFGQEDAVQAAMAMNQASISNAISLTIDEACKDWKRRH